MVAWEGTGISCVRECATSNENFALKSFFRWLASAASFLCFITFSCVMAIRQ